MAVKVLTPVKAEDNIITGLTLEAATAAADGFEFEIPRNAKDIYLAMIVQNTGNSAYKVAVKAPVKGSYAAATSDLTKSLAAGEIAVIRIESARYAGTDKKVVIVPDNVAVKAAVIY